MLLMGLAWKVLTLCNHGSTRFHLFHVKPFGNAITSSLTTTWSSKLLGCAGSVQQDGVLSHWWCLQVAWTVLDHSLHVLRESRCVG